MASVSQTITSYLGGVSNQPDDKKLPGQVKEALNAYTDPTFGLTKRPGFKYMSQLQETPIAGTYAQNDGSGGTDKTITVTSTGHGVVVGEKVYLDFTSGTAKDSYFIVESAGHTANAFTVEAEAALNTTGNVSIIKFFDNTDLDKAKWFYYSRDSDEKYLGCIVGNSTAADANVHVWNTIPDSGEYKKATITHRGTLVSITSNGGGSGTAGVLTGLATTTGGSGSGLKVDVTIDSKGVCSKVVVTTEGDTSYEYGDTITIAKSLIPGSGSGSNIDADIVCKITAREVIGSYLNSEKAADYDFLTIRDTSIITNKTKSVTAIESSTASDTTGKVGTIRIHLVEYSAKYEVTVVIGATTYTCTCSAKAGDTAASDASTTPFLSSKDLLKVLDTGATVNGCTYAGHASGLDGIPNMTTTIIGNTIELSNTSAFTCTITEAGKGGNALTSFQDSVDNISDLPAETKHNRIVKIVNTGAVASTYYAKFIANDSTSGPGVWEETIAPGVDTGLDWITLPHKLVCTAKNTFEFTPITYVDRLVGDDTTNEHPSFKGEKIQQAFYYNNRLGFLTEDNVSMSRAGSFFNFYFQTAQGSSDADPIDISCSSIRPAVLHGIVPTAGGLILFSQNQQFLMFSTEGNLTPSTALIRGISNYKMDTEIDPVDVGTNINFISKTHSTAGFSRVFGLLPQAPGVAPRVVDIGRVVSEYIPATIDSLTASPQNSFIAMYGRTKEEIYFYRTYSDGEKDLIQSWFKWKCPGTAQFVVTDADTMYSIVKTGTGAGVRYSLLSASLTQTPEETIIVTSDGQLINPYMDFYANASNAQPGDLAKTIEYDSTGKFSKVYIPYTDIAELEPVLIIAGNGTENFDGVTESGFYTEDVTRVTDGATTYLKHPGKDLTAQASNVIVGYKFGYDVTLPKLYFQKDPSGRLADYTANLTIARMKFSMGLTSEVIFKLANKGYRGHEKDITNNSTETALKPDTTFNSTWTTTTGTIADNTYTNITQKSTSGSGTGMKVTIKTDSAGNNKKVKSIEVTDEGKGYKVGDTFVANKDHIGQDGDVTFTITVMGRTVFPFPSVNYIDSNDIAVEIDGRARTEFTVQPDTNNGQITFTNPPGKDKKITIYLKNWHWAQSTQRAEDYIADDIPLGTSNIFTVPIHRKTDDYTIRVFSDKPYPVSLTSMAWEGVYSPRYYRRT